MRKRVVYLLMFVAAAGLVLLPAAPANVSCAWAQNNKGALPPAPTAVRSDYLTTELFSFGIDKEGEAWVARYTLSVVPTKPLTKELFFDVRFENPLDKESPLVVRQSLKPADERAMVVSPSVTGLKCGLYKAEVVIYDSDGREKSIGTHVQMIRSAYDLSKIKKPKDLEALSKC